GRVAAGGLEGEVESDEGFASSWRVGDECAAGVLDGVASAGGGGALGGSEVRALRSGGWWGARIPGGAECRDGGLEGGRGPVHRGSRARVSMALMTAGRTS